MILIRSSARLCRPWHLVCSNVQSAVHKHLASRSIHNIQSELITQRRTNYTDNSVRYLTTKGYASLFTGSASSETVAQKSLPIPSHISHKVCTPSDAVSLISQGDTVCVSGFVGQGSPDLILKALSDRYERECQEGVMGGVSDLTLLFGGGPGDWDSRGLNYLAKVKCPESNNVMGNSLVKRAIGGHYGQVPELRKLATSNQIEAWTLPMGSISRMIRAQSTHSPGEMYFYVQKYCNALHIHHSQVTVYRSHYYSWIGNLRRPYSRSRYRRSCK